MINRENVSALLNEIMGNLNTYLRSYEHSMLNEETARAGYNVRYDNGITHRNNYHYIQYKDGQCIAFRDVLGGRNTQLTLHRMKNLYTVRDALNDILRSLDDSHNERNLPLLISQIRNLLLRGQQENTALSSQFFNMHRSYHENQLVGLGIFSSWWHKTWTQSRANVALEKSLTTVDTFAKKFISQQDVVTNEIDDRSQPPAYVPEGKSSVTWR